MENTFIIIWAALLVLGYNAWRGWLLHRARAEGGSSSPEESRPRLLGDLREIFWCFTAVSSVGFLLQKLL